jgi:predicted transposase/invertase (TIGR01784 family)
MAKAEGRAEGKAEGKLEERRAIALKLLQQSIPLTVIAEATGFSIEQIRQLQPQV